MFKSDIELRTLIKLEETRVTRVISFKYSLWFGFSPT
jgi:hypothetical protein